MSEKVTYDINSVVSKLCIKIANLEAQLAHTQAANEAYQSRIKELEEEEE